jgi:hypothetical protein
MKPEVTVGTTERPDEARDWKNWYEAERRGTRCLCPLRGEGQMLNTVV